MIEPVLESIEACARAARYLGGTLDASRKTFKWWGRWEQDYHEEDAAYKQGVAVEDYGKCDAVISFPGVQYEVGLIKTDAGYRLIFDYVDWKLEQLMGGKEAHRFVQEYARSAVELEAESLGYNYTTQLVEGQYEIEVQESSY